MIKKISTRIGRHRHAGTSHALDTSGIGMILSVETLEVEQKTLLVNLVQLQAHLHLNKRQTLSTTLCCQLHSNQSMTNLFWSLETRHLDTVSDLTPVLSEYISSPHLLPHLINVQCPFMQ